MPTPSEQKALAFLTFVILLGGAVRIVRSGAPTPPTSEEQGALSAQMDAVTAAGEQGPNGKRGSGARRVSRGRRDAVPDSAHSNPGADRAGWVNGYPPPSPRIDIDNRLPSPKLDSGAPPRGRRGRGALPPAQETVVPLDLDGASVREIEGLPRIGPAMAARIVANRDSFGPFSSLEGLGRVRGIGSATLRGLGSRVTFSGRAASPSAGSRHQ